MSSQFYISLDKAQAVSLRCMTSEISVLLDSEHLRILVENVAHVMVFLRIYLFNNFSRVIAYTMARVRIIASGLFAG